MIVKEIKPRDQDLNASLESLRSIRNSVRSFMTGNQELIERFEQRWWFHSLDHETFRVFLFYKDGGYAGYGIIRLDVDRQVPVVTGALIESARGKGYGEFIFTYLRDRCLEQYGECWLDVLPDNNRALNLYDKLGFVVTDRTPEKTTMRYKGAA